MIRPLSGSVAVLFTEKRVCVWMSESVCVCVCGRIVHQAPHYLLYAITRWDLWPPQGGCESPIVRQLGARTHPQSYTSPLWSLLSYSYIIVGLKMLESKHQTALIKVSQPESKLNNLRDYFYFCHIFCRGSMRRGLSWERELVFQGLYKAAGTDMVDSPLMVKDVRALPTCVLLLSLFLETLRIKIQTSSNTNDKAFRR